MDMVEKVKAAILKETERQGHESPSLVYAVYLDPDGLVVLDGHFDFKAITRAAIEAMRDPTEEMIDAADTLSDEDFLNEMKYTRMIDAALETET